MKITRAKQPTPAPQAPGQAVPADAVDDDIDAGLNELLFGIAQTQAAPAAPAPAPVTVTEPQQKKKSEFVEEGDPLYVEIYERIMRERPQTSDYEARMTADIVANNPRLQGHLVAEFFPQALVTRVAPEHQHGAYKS